MEQSHDLQYVGGRFIALYNCCATKNDGDFIDKRAYGSSSLEALASATPHMFLGSKYLHASTV